MQYLGHSYTRNVFVVYLKFKFNWVFCILSCNPEEEGGRKHGRKGRREEGRQRGREGGREEDMNQAILGSCS